MTERPTRTFWVVSPETDMPVEVVGYEYSTRSKSVWWFPGIGYSIPESRCYADEATAAREAITVLESRQRDIEHKLARLADYR